MKLLCYETGGQWTALVRRRMPGDISIVDFCDLEELWPQLLQFGAAVVAIQWTAEHAEALLAALARIAREFPQAVTIVLASRDLAGWDELCREAGATHFVTSTRQMDDIAAIVKRRMQLGVGSDPNESMPLEDRILANLPWPEMAREIG